MAVTYHPLAVKSFDFLLSLEAMAVLLAAPERINGQIFVGSPTGGVISEYTISGTRINQTLISGLGYPIGMITDGDGHLFVANEGSRTVGEYTTSGVTINNALISVLGDPEGVALDGQGHLFVANQAGCRN